jgi:peptidoglycan/LPS O-acetylase OafA/YrhL
MEGRVKAHDSGQRNWAIDIARLFFACGIVFLHIFLGYALGASSGHRLAFYSLLMAIVRLAVPFFFMVSGYYFFSHNASKENRRAGKEIKKLAIIFVVAMIGSIVVDYCCGYLKSFRQLLPSYDAWKALIFSQAPDWLVPFSGQYWFFLALILCYAFFWLLNIVCPKSKNKIVAIAAFAGVAVAIFGFPYRNLIGVEPGFGILATERGFLTMGLVFFAIGYFLRKTGLGKNLSIKKTLLLFLVLLLAGAYEIYCLKASGAGDSATSDWFLITPAVSFMLFVILLKIGSLKSKISQRFVAWCKRNSLYVYVLHIAIYSIIAKIINTGSALRLNAKRFLLTLIITMIVSAILDQVILFVGKIRRARIK